MRVIVQVVKNASVKINQEVYSSIDYGFLLLVGFTLGDTKDIAKKVAEKIIKLRILPDDQGKTNKAVTQVNGAILSVSQFSLYGDVKKSNRPSFTASLNHEESHQLYDYFNSVLNESGLVIKTGVFRENMDVEFTNVGPFSLILDSEELYGQK